MHGFLFRSWRPLINVVENVQNYIFGSKHGSWGERKQSVVVVQGLDGPLSVRCFVT